MVFVTMSRPSSASSSYSYIHSLFPLMFFILFSELHHTTVCFAADTISVNQSLSGNQTITSASGKFVLGFFQPGNSTNYYVAIWYSFSTSTSVWVANRENPVSDPGTSELKISKDGNLVLLDSSKSTIWSTEANVSSNSSVAILLDDGNLHLRDDSDSSNLFWQSFDHPGDTWLPGSKLALNKQTKKSQHLTSWKNSADPAPGIFNLELDPNGTTQYYILWNQSIIYWTSGAWDDKNKIFTNVPEMTQGYAYEFEFVSNDQENYFKYSVRNSSLSSRFVMSTSGQIMQLTWLTTSQEWLVFWIQPKQQCDVYDICGPFGSCTENVSPNCNCLKGFSKKNPSGWALNDQSGGCARNTALQCQTSSSGNAEKDKFFQMSNTKLPVNSQNIAVTSDGDCQSTCLNNCSCTAYAYNSSGCFIWHGELLNVQEQYTGSDAVTLYLRLAASEFPTSKSNNGTVIVILVVVVATVVACAAIFWFMLRRRKNRLIRSTAKIVQGTVAAFRYFELQLATKNFSEKLGGGGFGAVFKGTLPDSTNIAVKKLQGVHQGEKQFRTEVSTIGTIQHVNLVRLLGFCSEGTKKLLVYEYMSKGSLDTHLFEGSSITLDWKTRYQIAIGTARGLAYLHEECRDRIIHCDIKPENILLDESFVPKVADFGLAKLLGREFSRVLTTMRGTRGYLAPEWITGIAISAKADVYSYGMMLLEIISGRRNTEQGSDDRVDFFPTVAAGKLVEGEVLNLLDSRLNGNANLMELEKVCKIACWCIQDDEDLRPTMVQVVQVLEGLLEVNMPPIPRSIQLFAESPDKINFFSDLSSNQSSQTRSTASTISETKGTSS